MLSAMEGRPKRQSAIDKDYRVRKRIRKDKEPASPTEEELQIEEQDPTQDQCRRLYKYIKEYKDEDGDPLCTLFQQLPSRQRYPDYYEVIKQPIALNTMKAKIDKDEYSSVAQFKADIELMVANAKKYNMKESQVYQNAVLIQKLVKSWKHDDPMPTASSKKDKQASGPNATTDRKGKTMLKLPGEAFANGSRSNAPQEPKVKSLKLKTAEKPMKKKVSSAMKDLMAAIAAGESKVALDILESEPNLDVNELTEVELFDDTFTWAPLHAAAYYGDIKVCNALIKHGADVELNDTWHSATPLGWAAYADQDKVARILVQNYHANRKAKNIHGQIPLDVVEYPDDPKWVGILKPPFPKSTQNLGDKNRTPEQSLAPQAPTQESTDQQPKKRRGRPPKAETEILAAANRPVEEIDLNDFDPVAYMRELFHTIRTHTDNVGRQYSDIFEDLPDREDYPDYYSVIKKPRSLSIIESNMIKRKYPTLKDWFQDMVLVFQNAIEYNEPGSRVHKDARLLLRLLHRMKERILSREGVPDTQERDVMKMSIADRPYEVDDKRRPKRATSKPRTQPEQNLHNVMDNSGNITIAETGKAPVSAAVARPYINMPTGHLPPQQTPMMAANMMATHMAKQPGYPEITPEGMLVGPFTYNGYREHQPSDQRHIPHASAELISFFKNPAVRPLTSIKIETPDKSFQMSLDGRVVGHSLTVPSHVQRLNIMPCLHNLLQQESKCISMAILQNNNKINLTENASTEAASESSVAQRCWMGAPLVHGLNTFKITITANITDASVTGGMIEYKTQIYFLFVTQTW